MGLKVDMAFPCATQNEIGEEEAKQLIANGVKYIIEGANMPTTPEGVHYFLANGGTLGPAKAANAGGVAVFCIRNVSKLYAVITGQLKKLMKNFIIL